MSLTNTEICEMMVSLDQFMYGERMGAQFRAVVPTIRALGERQLVRFGALNAGFLNGCQTASVVWLEQCDNAIVACDSSSPILTCDIGGNPATSMVQSMTHNLCKTLDFSVDLSSCNNHFTPAMLRAQQLAIHIAKIEKDLNLVAGAHLAANAETVAVASTPATGVPVGGDPGSPVDYPVAEWDASIIAKIMLLSEKEGLYDPYLISGGLLYQDYVTALVANPNCCDPDRSVMTQGPMDIIFDIKDLDNAVGNPGQRNAFSVDPGSHAFWSSNNYENDTPQALNDKNNTWIWRIKSPQLTFADGGVQRPVYYDVMRQVTCMTGGAGVKAGPNGHYTVENYRVIFNGGLQQGPDTTCAGDLPGTSTGIIHLTEDGA